MTHKNHYRPIPENEKIAKHIPDINLMLSFHVETIVLLSHKDIEEHVKLSYEPEQKPSTHFRDATYEEIKSWVLEHYGLKVSSLYIAQVKEECGLGKRENYNKSKKKDAKVPLCPENKKEAIKASLEHFEMINDWKKMPE